MKSHYSSSWRFKDSTFSSPSQTLRPNPHLPSMSAVYFYRSNNCSPALLNVSVIYSIYLDVFYKNIFVHFDSRLNPVCCYHCACFQARFHIVAKGTYQLRLVCPALPSARITSAFTIQMQFNLILLLLLQSALQPQWVMAYPTIVEYSQQEGLYRVLLPAARQTPNLEDQ